MLPHNTKMIPFDEYIIQIIKMSMLQMIEMYTYLAMFHVI